MKKNIAPQHTRETSPRKALNTYVVREIQVAEFERLFKTEGRGIVGKSQLGQIIFNSAFEAMHIQRPEAYFLCYGLFRGTKMLGWTTGFNISSTIFCIDTSAVHPGHRGQNLYGELLTTLMKRATECGFQTIRTYHYESLSHLIAKKLRLGFFITGFELDASHGPVVQLDYYVNKRRREILRFRSGESKPDAKVRLLFKLESPRKRRGK